MKRTFMQGFILGIAMSILCCIWKLFVLYSSAKDWEHIDSFAFYVAMPLSTCLLTFFLLRLDRIRYILIAVLMSIAGFLLAEMLTVIAEIIPRFFQHLHGYGEEMWAGDGFGLMFANIMCFLGGGVGIVLSFVAFWFRSENKSV